MTTFNQSTDIAELAAALSKAQSVMGAAPKDSQNPFYKSYYADLSSIWSVCRQPLTDNGLSVCQCTEGEDLITILMHSSGQWIRSSMPIRSAKPNDPQSYGSGLSYARRYSLAAIAGVVTDDDDAEGATDRTEKPDKKPEKVQQPKTYPKKDNPDPAWVQDPNYSPPEPDMQKMITDKQIKYMHLLGQEVYGPEWDKKREELVAHFTRSKSTSLKDLTLEMASKLIDGLNNKKPKKEGE